MSGWTVVVDERTCIGRASGGGFDAPGLYLFRRSEARWEADLLLADSEDRQRVRCLWAVRETDRYRMVVKAEGETRESVTYWRVELADGVEPTLELIAAFDERVAGEDVSPDGGVLACLRRAGGSSPVDRLVLTPIRQARGAVRSMRCSEDVAAARFGPKGEQLLLWGPGWLEGASNKEGPRAGIQIVDLARNEVADVELPAELRALDTLTSVSWLSENSVALGLVDYGVAALNLSAGAYDALWRVPAER